MIPRILHHLTTLVGCDTQNPPRTIGMQSPLFDHLAAVCGRGFQIDVIDGGEGRIAWRARRGNPSTMFHAHLDTVPATAAWSTNPLSLQVSSDRATGLGACDIKGAAACLLALAENSQIDLDLLFTTDEEGSKPCAVDRFIQSVGSPPRMVVVCEPTQGQVVLGHRGYLSARGNFRGVAGHTSLPRAARRSAVHDLIAWSAAALNHVVETELRDKSRGDYCFNLGLVSGGLKGNMIADRAEVRWSARPPSGCDVVALRDRLFALSSTSDAAWETTFLGQSFPCSVQLRQIAQQWMQNLSLPTAADVDFWTEAARFSEAGWPAVVLGPGDIRQAHSEGEWVGLEQLQSTFELYSRIAHGD